MVEITRLFSQTGAISRLTPDESDSDQEGYLTIVSSVACAVYPEKEEITAMLGGKLYKDFNIYFPSGTNLLAQDRVTIDDSIYTVSGIKNVTQGLNPHIRARAYRAAGS